MVNMLHRKKTCEWWFQRFKIGDFDVQTRNTKNRPKSMKTWNCKHCWMKMIHKHKNKQNNWVSQQAVSNRLREMGKIQKADGCHMNWTGDRWRGAKTRVKFCSNDTKESHFYIVSLLGMKSDFFWESQAQKIMGRPRRTIYIDRKTESLWQEDDGLCLMGRVWFIMSYWSLAKRLIPNAINNN